MRCLRLRRRRAERRRRQTMRAERLAASELCHQAWRAYDAMPSGPDKRIVLGTLCFGPHTAEYYGGLLPLIEQLVALPSDAPRR